MNLTYFENTKQKKMEVDIFLILNIIIFMNDVY